MFAAISGTMHPEGYHGTQRRSPYFEGWYFKIVDALENQRYAVIPGISLSEDGDGLGPHSFVQVLDGVTGATLYQPYPLDAFCAAPDTLDVRVGPNCFSWQAMTLDLAGTEIPLSGRVELIDPHPWPVTVLSPGIMGWYAWMPFMECYHGVLSLDHGLRGTLQTGSGSVDFGGGRGYLEKDWGKAFPSGWVWMQANHFDTPGICLTASIARIPWLGTTFTGFIVGLLWRGVLHRFATYTGARSTRLSVDESTVDWILEKATHRLTLRAHRARAGHLRGPSLSDMSRPVPETLSATIEVKLTTLKGAVLLHETGRCGGLEIGGDIGALIST